MNNMVLKIQNSMKIFKKEILQPNLNKINNNADQHYFLVGGVSVVSRACLLSVPSFAYEDCMLRFIKVVTERAYVVFSYKLAW